MLTFKEYVSYREGQTVMPNTPNQNPQSDANLDKEIMKNPQLLKTPPKPGQNPRAEDELINQTIAKTKQTGAPLPAVMRAQRLAQRNQ